MDVEAEDDINEGEARSSLIREDGLGVLSLTVDGIGDGDSRDLDLVARNSGSGVSFLAACGTGWSTSRSESPIAAGDTAACL